MKRNNLELQFWGYEGGNVVATVAGAGGFSEFFNKVDGVLSHIDMTALQKFQVLSADYPDAFVTIGLGAVVLLASVVRRAAEGAGGEPAMNLIDFSIALVALGILGYAFAHDTSWITVSASAFVVGSSFLRQCRHNPFLLKAGGLALALGGAALAAFGVEGLIHAMAGSEALHLTLGALTVGTGIYVTGASLLTYQGGIYETAAYAAGAGGERRLGGALARLIHPTEGLIARFFTRSLDRPIAWAGDHIVNPAIFWASRETKQQRPFAASMWARLPWRLATGSVAMATGTPQGMAFGLANLGWIIGDLSIGSLDWQEHQSRQPRRAPRPA